MANSRQGNGKRNGAQVAATEEGVGSVPYGASQVGPHDYVPMLGYREYWYPAIQANKVGKRPVRVKMLGEELVFFRGKGGKVAALWDRCPHRGALLSYGRCEFEGTISCPYHGYTYDETGTCVAALTEGPDSSLAGKLKARSYPTVEVRGLVFVWMGETEPAPIEEDVPKELFDEKNVTVFTYIKEWPMNWAISIENVLDSHNLYIHRGRIRRAINGELFQEIPAYWTGTEIAEEGENYIGIAPRVASVSQAYYPRLGKKWPQRVWWRLRGSSFQWNNPAARTWRRTPYSNEYRLPCMALVDFGNRTNVRWSVPIDENTCRVLNVMLYDAGGWWHRLVTALHYHIVHRYWGFKLIQELEDIPVQRSNRLDQTAPNKLGVNDRTIIFWRRRMPMKSRDNQRIWKKRLPPTDEAEATEEHVEELTAPVGAGDEGA